MKLENELRECRRFAEEGYRLASTSYDKIRETLIEEAQRLSKTDEEQNEVKRIQNTQLVEEQKEELRRLTDGVKKIQGDLDNLRGRMKDFSIVVYGRTMAGKSTLMEILTHGNGKSIGKGAQRTTRDVRDYYWQGLKITDLPGICAFNGAEDERKALEAAKSADLILFLLTGDAPQADEAACLAQLKNLGKPVLGVINVKMSFNINDELDVEDLEDKLSDLRNVNEILRQFKSFAARHNQDWSGIKFVATHLLSAYQSQDRNPKVFRISRFADVENFIIEKIRADGRFLRIKTFADSVAVPMNNIILKIYEHSGKTLLESDVWFDKRRQLSEWRKNFSERAKNRLDVLHEILSGDLDSAIHDFAESHYEDERVNEHWQQRLQKLNFDGRYRALLKELAEECERKRNELSDQLKDELKFNFQGQTLTKIELEGTTPWGKWAAIVLPNLLMFIPGIGWGARIALGVGGALLGFLFDNKQEKIREAKRKLRADLKVPSHDMLDKMHSQVVEIFDKEILVKGVDEFYNLLAGYQFMLARLGKSQYKIARKLFKNFSNLNAQLLEEAIVCKGAGFISSVEEVARVPGETLVAFASRANLNGEELSDLLGEKFLSVKPQEKLPDTVKNILNCEFEIYHFPLAFDNEESEKAVALFPKAAVDVTKFKLAQQLAGVPIIVRQHGFIKICALMIGET